MRIMVVQQTRDFGDRAREAVASNQRMPPRDRIKAIGFAKTIAHYTDETTALKALREKDLVGLIHMERTVREQRQFRFSQALLPPETSKSNGTGGAADSSMPVAYDGAAFDKRAMEIIQLKFGDGHDKEIALRLARRIANRYGTQRGLHEVEYAKGLRGLRTRTTRLDCPPLPEEERQPVPATRSTVLRSTAATQSIHFESQATVIIQRRRVFGAGELRQNTALRLATEIKGFRDTETALEALRTAADLAELIDTRDACIPTE